MTSVETPGCPTLGPSQAPEQFRQRSHTGSPAENTFPLSRVALALVVSRLRYSPARDPWFSQAKSVGALHLNAKR